MTVHSATPVAANRARPERVTVWPLQALIIAVISLLLCWVPIAKQHRLFPRRFRLGAGGAGCGKVIEDVATSVEVSARDADAALGADTQTVLAENLDVWLGTFTAAEDELGIVDSKLVVTVKNIGDAPVSGDLTVVADSADGARIAEDYVFVESLAAGQTTRPRRSSWSAWTRSRS